MMNLIVEYLKDVSKEDNVQQDVQLTVLVCGSSRLERLIEQLETEGHYIIKEHTRTCRKPEFWKRQDIDWVVIDFDPFDTPEPTLVSMCFIRAKKGLALLITKKTKDAQQYRQDLIDTLGSPKELGKGNWLVWRKHDYQPTILTTGINRAS